MKKTKLIITGTDDIDKKIQALKEFVDQIPVKENKDDKFQSYKMPPNKDGVSVEMIEEDN